MHGIYYNNFTMHLRNDTDRYILDFWKNNGFYTNRALFYQDILRYSTIAIEREFKDRELTRWLLENNQELIDYYEGPPNNRRDGRYWIMWNYKTEEQNDDQYW